MAVGDLGARYEMNIGRIMMLGEVAMENWPKISEWCEFHHEVSLLWPVEFVDVRYPKPASLPLYQHFINVSAELEAGSWSSSENKLFNILESVPEEFSLYQVQNCDPCQKAIL